MPPCWVLGHSNEKNNDSTVLGHVHHCSGIPSAEETLMQALALERQEQGTASPLPLTKALKSTPSQWQEHMQERSYGKTGSQKVTRAFITVILVGLGG